MSSLICMHKEERVVGEEEPSVVGADRYRDTLTVPGDPEIVFDTWTMSAWQPWETLKA